MYQKINNFINNKYFQIIFNYQYIFNKHDQKKLKKTNFLIKIIKTYLYTKIT